MERQQQIEEIFHEALQRDPADRDAFLRHACRDDSGLRREVASLLAHHNENQASESWAAFAAAQLVNSPASLQPGQSLGPYRIDSFIAAGGMGEVYRATDTRLHREVAIKVCGERFSERFTQEARIIASLNHPHICHLYDVGPNYLVMELVEGPTLADRIQQGALPLEEALTIARQIAEGLEAAHEKGTIHRDLKPANVKITPEGVVKVLDFGLAKAVEQPSAAADPGNAPTLTVSPTRVGMILGTAPYMSPEQARGAAVDKRADIWAFGCVLYEMLTGKQPFHGETTSDILAAVLKGEPDWSRTPARVQPLLRRCLEKDPKRRLRDIGDAVPLLENVPEPAPVRRPWPWVLAAVLAVAAAVGWWRATRPAPLRPLVRLTAELSPGTTIDMFRSGSQWAISPDGARLAVVVRDLTDGKYRLVTRRLEESEFAPLAGTEGANAPFFSPDGQWIAFFADGKLKKVAVQGGTPATLCDAAGVTGGGSWGDDGNIIAALNAERILWRIPSSGGVPTRATELDKKNGETAQSSPQVLPGSQAVLFSSNVGGTSYDREIAVVSFRNGRRKTLHRGGSAYYLPSGHLVYTEQNTLYAAPFDLNRLSLTGAPRPVLEDIQRVNPIEPARYDVSQSGTLIYVSSKGQFSQSIFWLDSAGKTKPLHSTPGFYFQPRFSPDGKRLAFPMGTAQPGRDIWMKDLERDTMSRLTSAPGMAEHPVWAPDGKSIVFNAFGQPASGLYWIRTDGSGELQQLTDGKTRLAPSSFSPDGKRLAYSEFSGGHSQIWTAPVEGDSDHPRLGKAVLFLRTPSYLGSPVYSPDGRWLAYFSNETGTYEVYVRPFPGPGAKWQISTGGGQYPIWSRNKQELFFLTLDRRIMVASYTVNRDSFAPGKPQPWSEKRLMYASTYLYDLAPDGKRFAVVLNADGTAEEKPFTQLAVLLNFFDELRRPVPAGGQ